MAYKVSNKLADEALIQIKEQFGAWIEEGYEPRIARFWEGDYSTHDLVVVWEHGPMDWPRVVKDGGWAEENQWPAAKAWPDEVWPEAVNHYVLAIHASEK